MAKQRRKTKKQPAAAKKKLQSVRTSSIAEKSLRRQIKGRLANKKPHISRNISRIAIVAVLLVMATYSILDQMELRQKNHAYQQLQNAVLVNPVGIGEHEHLAAFFLAKNNFAWAKQEYKLAAQFGDKQAVSQLEGVTTKEQAPDMMRGQLLIWQRFVAEHPEYRDGYMEIAMLWWVLGDKEQSKQALAHVLTLDPNYEPAMQLMQNVNE